MWCTCIDAGVLIFFIEFTNFNFSVAYSLTSMGRKRENCFMSFKCYLKCKLDKLCEVLSPQRSKFTSQVHEVRGWAQVYNVQSIPQDIRGTIPKGWMLGMHKPASQYRLVILEVNEKTYSKHLCSYIIKFWCLLNFL